MAVSFVQKRLMSSGLQKWCYSLAGFNKLGLMRDDLLYEDSVVQEALRRCPQHLVDERNFRILRATQLSLTKGVLPKAQWMKLENDKLYLTPFVNEIIREKEEAAIWNKTH